MAILIIKNDHENSFFLLNMNLIEINCNIFDTNAQYIAHQCNCVSFYSKGLASEIFKRYPDANVYINGKRRIPGTIDVSGRIINMFAQFYPGSPRAGDSQEDRHKWFTDCLNEIRKIFLLESVAFPHMIGCGLAGGNWTIYRALIRKFADNNPRIKVYICKK